jgi:hypothetical protein
MTRIFDPLHPDPSDSASLLKQLAATARERSMNGTILIATEFHGFPPPVFRGEWARSASGLIGCSAGWDFG